MLIRSFAVLAAFAAPASFAGAIWDIRADWSETQNPNGPWALLEGNQPLPHVDSWQSSLGGWSQPQPGWARSENGNNRIPFFFLSNGSEQFACDFGAGDTVMHSWDAASGTVNGQGRMVWTAPYRCYIRVRGEVWLGRDIGRSVTVFVRRNEVTLVTAPLSSGDAWSSANPFVLNSGAGPLNIVQMNAGDLIDVTFQTVSVSGEFVVLNDYTIEDIGCPPDLSLDGEIGFADLNLLLGQFNQTGDDLTADIDDDGDVDFADLNFVLSAFNLPCPDGN